MGSTAMESLTGLNSKISIERGKFKEAFEKKYSGVTVEVVGKKTTAGIKYIQETKSNNGTDLFWASAPDAFEV